MPDRKFTEIRFCGKTFSSPLVLPSGIFTTLNDFKNARNHGAGAVTTKSYTYYPRRGHAAPVVVKYGQGFINSVGLRNLGISEAKKQITEFRKNLDLPVIVSIFDTKIKDFCQLILHLLPLKPRFIELNLSCPNVEDDFGKPLATGSQSAYEVVKMVKELVSDDTKIIAKLSPNVVSIKDIAKAVEEAGADAISAINTVGPGMLIDIKAKKPMLGAGFGGVSGPAIKPIALKCVFDIYETVNLPIIGMGGVTSWQDAVEMLLAGATLVGVGSALYLQGMKAFTEINGGIGNYLRENNYQALSDIIGLAHE